nr:DUF4181 domain-containing protein [Aquibacillus halophilus]
MILFYLFISELYLKRYLKIKPPRRVLFYEGRSKLFVVIEVILMVLFIISSYYLARNYHLSHNIRTLPMFIFFLLVFFNRGMEEWKVRKSERGYLHEWLGSIMFFNMILFIFIGEYLSK